MEKTTETIDCPTNCLCSDPDLPAKAFRHSQAIKAALVLSFREGDFQAFIKTNLVRAIAKRDWRMTKVLTTFIAKVINAK